MMGKISLVFLSAVLSLSSYSQKNLQLRSVLSYPETLSNVWGYSDSASNEYAFVGVYNGLSIVNVTNPDSISELFFIPGPKSTWRNIKVWNNHAYITNETDSGLLIIDLNFLPDSINHLWWTGDSLLRTAHTAYIDESGFLYCSGYNNVAKTIPYDQKGILICDLKPDPKNPVLAGSYNLEYVHDCYVRGDTIWAAQMSDGSFGVIEASDKANLTLMATRETPNRFTHNCWLSADGKYLFTTDERPNSFIGSYDVSDLDNIKEVDKYQAAPFTGLIPHNVYWHNDFLVIAYYKYGVAVVDATDPSNLVEVGYYDTSPFPNSEGYQGCWGVYPYLPSGNILATDIETGLYVFTPDYKRACYLIGNVKREQTNEPVFDVRVEVMTTNSIKTTDLLGNYRTGVVDAGTYDVRFYKDGCIPKIITEVKLETANTDTLNVSLSCVSVGISSLNEGENLTLLASPSMFRDRTNIYYRLDDFNEEARLQVFDMAGKMVRQIYLHDYEGEVELRNLPSSGVHIVRLVTEEKSSVVKILKM